MNARPRVRQQRRAAAPHRARLGAPALIRAAAVAALAALAGCTGPGRACTEVGGIDLIALDIAPEVRADLTTLHVELCQSEVCGDITFPTATPSSTNVIQPGVALDAGTYTVALGALGEGWDARAPARLRIDGDSATGATVVRRSESFEFDVSYPNGKGCEPEALSHASRIDGTDRAPW